MEISARDKRTLLIIILIALAIPITSFGIKTISDLRSKAQVPPGVDMQVVSINLITPGPYFQGQWVDFQITLKNNGSTSAASSIITQGFKHSPNIPICGVNQWGPAPDGDAGTFSDPYDQDQTRTQTTAFQVPTSDGTFSLGFFADSDCKYAEANETDNYLTKTYTVSGPPPGGGADLSVDSIVLNTTGPYFQGQWVDFHFNVRNIGSSATAGSVFIQGFKHSPAKPACGVNQWGPPPDGDAGTGSDSFDPGQTRTYNWTFQTPTSDGAFSLGIFADSSCLSTEANETDNYLTKTYTVSGPLPGGGSTWVNKIVVNVDLPAALQGLLAAKLSIIATSPEFNSNLGAGNNTVTLTIPDGVFAISTVAKGLKIAVEKSLLRIVGFIPNAKELIINAGLIKLGDLNADNIINSIDYSILVSSYMPLDDEKADLNLDTVVNSIDYSIMLSSYLQEGDQESGQE